MTTASTGTGSPITLGSAVDGYQTFADAGVVNSDVVRYVIEDGSDWEISTGTYTTTGTTLSRTLVESSTGSLLNLSGNAVVYVIAAAQDIQQPPAEGAFVDGDKTKLDGIEAGADVTDAANVEPLVDTHLNTSSATTGQYLGWNGSDYAWSTVSGAALTAVSTSGANQTVNFDTTDIHVSTLDAESVTYTFSNTNQVEALTLSLKNNILIPDSVQGVFLSYSVDLSSDFSQCYGVGFKSDGTKAYIRGYTGSAHTIKQYSLSTAWDLRTATLDGSLGVAMSSFVENGVPLFKSDGTKMYTANNGYYQYSLTTPWDITSGVTADGLVHSSAAADLAGSVNPDGTKFYSSTSGSGTQIAETVLTTPWDFSTATTTQYGLANLSGVYTNLLGITLISSGNKIIARGDNVFSGYGIMLMNLVAPYDASSSTWDPAENYLYDSPSSSFGVSTDTSDTYMYLGTGSSSTVEVFTINGLPSLTFPTSIVNSSSISTPNYQDEFNIDLFTYDGGTSYHLK